VPFISLSGLKRQGRPLEPYSGLKKIVTNTWPLYTQGSQQEISIILIFARARKKKIIFYVLLCRVLINNYQD